MNYVGLGLTVFLLLPGGCRDLPGVGAGHETICHERPEEFGRHSLHRDGPACSFWCARVASFRGDSFIGKLGCDEAVARAGLGCRVSRAPPPLIVWKIKL